MLNEKRSNSIIEYSHLISLDISESNIDYIVQFLLQTKTHLTRLTELKVDYYKLQDATNDFRRNAMRHNCSRVKQLIPGVGSDTFERYCDRNLYRFFPSLQNSIEY